jgi:membrane protein YqaA with SNARE-associated domain
MEYFAGYSYTGLFIASFLAATILPLSSEVVLGFLLLTDLSSILLVSVATFGNVLGSLVNYAMGFWGSVFLTRQVFKISDDDFSRAKERFEKYGVISLLFAWVPVIGDPLTVVAGVLKINILLFFVLVTSGKLIRYIIISCVILNSSP